MTIQQLVASGRDPIPPAPVGSQQGITVATVGPQVNSWDLDPFGGDGLPGPADDLLGGLAGLPGKAGGYVAGKVTGEVAQLAAGALLFTAALGLGVALVVIGLAKTAS